MQAVRVAADVRHREKGMTAEQVAAALSILATLLVAVASFGQWFTVQLGGGLPLRKWPKVVLLVAIVMLVAALGFLGCGVLNDPGPGTAVS